MLERKHVAFYARASGVREEIAERDVVLTYVLRILLDSILPHLALKGGTWLKRTYFGKTGRFSMDLDFTSVDLSCEKLKSRIQDSLDNKTSYRLDFKIIEENLRSDAYLAVVRYAHHWNEGSQFELQVSCREKPLLEVVKQRLIDEMYWKFCVHEFQRFSVWCLQKEEALAEKIRAAFQRMQSRDVYDLYLFTEVPQDKDAVKTLVVIKTCPEGKSPFAR